MSARSKLNAFLDVVRKVPTYDAPFLNAEVVSSSKDETVFALIVGPELCNSLGSMHGGAIATAIDFFTTCSIAPASRGTRLYDQNEAILLTQREGFWDLGGVSRTLATTYVRAAQLDRVILFECRVVHLGSYPYLLTVVLNV